MPESSFFRGPKTSVKDLAGEFVQPYGLDIQPQLESSPFAVHDAAHRYTNIPATVYGELLQNVSDKAAYSKLYGSGALEGNPLGYGEIKRPSSAFPNWTPMPNPQAKGYQPGGAFENEYDLNVNQRITEQQQTLNQGFNIAENKLKKGETTSFAGAGEYDPNQGFMPTPDLRNVRGIAPEDVNTARVRGESYADELLKGYKKAVQEGRYQPQFEPARAQATAADLAEAAMRGDLKINRGWADEGIFPYKDKINVLSNPPARIDPRVVEPAALDFIRNAAEEAQQGREVNRFAGSLQTGAARGLGTGLGLSLLSPGTPTALAKGQFSTAAQNVARDAAIGATADVGTRIAGKALERFAPAAASVISPAVASVARFAGPAGLTYSGITGANEFVKARTGESILSKTRQFLGTQPRTGIMSPQLEEQTRQIARTRPADFIPSIRPQTPQERAYMQSQQNENEFQRRPRLAAKRFNPTKFEFGLSELLFGR
ncbi:hypothetical protein EBT25_00565 [bacterium]|nr:hypothetical protein [bacterium]